ncbi:hypothetical protein CNEO2_370001 [Clostridium neonatale]|nr:hypothetical protein CNEO2_370001 [Clostridium neonatale]
MKPYILCNRLFNMKGLIYVANKKSPHIPKSDFDINERK